MRKRINTDELEDYLKDVADSHRMYPSNQIWTNIRENLHGTPRWPALTFISLFIITSLIIGTVFIKPDERILKQIASSSNAGSKTVIEKNTFADDINPAKVTSGIVADILKNQLAATEIIEEETVPVYKPVDAQITRTSGANLIISQPHIPLSFLVEAPQLNMKEVLTAEVTQIESAETVSSDKEIEKIKVEYKQSNLSLNTSIVLPKRKKASRWDVGFYITPSNSFRIMTDDKRTKTNAGLGVVPVSTDATVDVNEVIRHKPAMGVETGLSFGYKLTGQLKLKAGVQLNIRQYDIEAYGSSVEVVQLEVSNGSRVDTLNMLSNYRNGNGAYEITLKNKYHEISVPIGVEWTNSLSKSLSWGVAGTIQPTYIFGKQAFLISNDYKNYTSEAPLFRSWNVNTSVEAYISYKAGKYTWQIGPQVRYQQLSSYSNKYPIKENLYDYGVKFGFTKTIR
jgi:hypothetical protein